MSDSTTVSPGRFSLARSVARALFTVPPFLAQHFWRRRRVDDVTRTVERLMEEPPEERHVDDPEVQSAADGSGPLVLRSYEVRITSAALGPTQLIERLIQRPGDLNDNRIAGFVRDDLPATDLAVGDELVVELPGPWNGPVRVTHVDDNTLLLQTLQGHMEAGQIRFDTVDHIERPDGSHEYTFRIRSWARGGNAAFTILHLGLKAAKEMQMAMWVAMCEGAVRVAAGTRGGRIVVVTEVLADSTPSDDVIGDLIQNVVDDR